MELILNGFYVKNGPDSYERVYESGVSSKKQTALNKFEIDGVGDLGCYWKALLLEVGD